MNAGISSVARRVVSTAIVLASIALPASADTSPVGTEFTYQGRLTEAGEPVTDPVDLTFRLFAQPSGGSPLTPGGVLVANDFQVGEDGYFTIDLDFGDHFNGEPRWLEIQVNATVLTPRQPVMPAPYAMVATTAANVPTKAVAGVYEGITGVGTLNSLNVSGNVGVGTTTPQDDLHVASNLAILRLEDTTTPGGFTQIYDAQPTQLRFSKTNLNGQVLMDLNPKPADGVSSASVRLFRETNTTGAKGLFLHRGDNTNGLSAFIGVAGQNSFFQLDGGNVGIGTSTPSASLHVIGDVMSSGWLRSLSPLADSEVFLGWGADENGDDLARIRIGGNGVGAINGLDIQKVNNVSIMRILNSGNVGIGTTLPTTKLNVVGTIRSQSGPDTLDINQNSINTAGDGFFGDPLLLNGSVPESVLIGFGGGNTGIGGGAAGLPLVKLHVDAGSDASIGNLTGGFFMMGAPNAANIVMDNNEIMARNDSAAATLFLNHEGGQVHIGQGSGGTGRLLTPVLQITGGSDLSERFDVAETDDLKPEPGMVVCIDPVNPGKLLPSSRAYDRTVAGVISGANGVNTGMIMGQEDSEADGEHPVALTGRVYVMCDATGGSIEPGDLLTTSDVPGHAMKVSEYDRAHGAIIGKAMSRLESGRGMVLVLVNLQ